MATKYYILVHNQIRFTDSFAFFNGPPDQGKLEESYPVVWYLWPVIGGMQWLQVEFPNDYFAVCGTTVGGNELGVKEQVNMTSSELVTPAPPAQDEYEPDPDESFEGDTVNMALVSDKFVFVPPAIPGVTLPGSFAIETSTFDSDEHKDAWCGYGRPDPDNNVKPCVCWRAKPNMQYFVVPDPNFYVGAVDPKLQASVEVGTVVDKSVFSSLVNVDFTGRGENAATIVQNDDGTFSPPLYSWYPDN